MTQEFIPVHSIIQSFFIIKTWRHCSLTHFGLTKVDYAFRASCHISIEDFTVIWGTYIPSLRCWSLKVLSPFFFWFRHSLFTFPLMPQLYHLRFLFLWDFDLLWFWLPLRPCSIDLPLVIGKSFDCFELSDLSSSFLRLDYSSRITPPTSSKWRVSTYIFICNDDDEFIIRI